MADRRWLVEALRSYERPLVRYAYGLTRNLETARDIAQDCFLRLCQQPEGKLNGRVKEWLFLVCRNRAIDHLRKERRMDALDNREPVATETPAAAAERGEEQVRVRRCLETLPARQREVLRLKFQEGLSYKQIAAVTHASVSNVGFLLHTALRTLRTRLGAPSGGSKS